MRPPADTTLVDLSRCPACSAAVRPDAQWCSLCYFDLRPPRAEQPPQQTTRREADDLTAPALMPVGAVLEHSNSSTPALTTPALTTPTSTAPDAAGWPCTSCSAVVPLELEACPECGAAFLARLAGDGGRHRSSSTDISRFSRPIRLAGGVLAGILIALLIPILLALFG
jgi:RNA polymerase subunit RPABC4/transcription elongation factor Spt4